MKKIKKICSFIVLSTLSPLFFVQGHADSNSDAYYESRYDAEQKENRPSYSQDNPNFYELNAEMNRENFRESTSERMSRHSQSLINRRGNSGQNREEQLQEDWEPQEGWESTSTRMNRQARSLANTRTKDMQNREEPQPGVWESTSTRMNRQAESVANTRQRETWIRVEQPSNNTNRPPQR